MTIVYLIRHGESEFNRRDIFRGTIDVPLNEHGGFQAEALGRVLGKVDLNAVYSSPLARAVNTAHMVALPHDLEVEIDPSFNNIRLGAWQGKAKSYIAEEYPDEWEMWKRTPTKLLIPDGESLGEVRERAWGKLKHLVQREHPRESIAIVTHRSVIKTLLGALVGLDVGYFWTFYVDTASYSTIIYKEDSGFYIHQLNMGCGVPSSSAEEF